MAVRITRVGKTSVVIDTPVMPMAGTFGYGDEYRDLLNIDKLGALVTNPVTYSPRSPAAGTHVVPLEAGVLVHTGLPNPGLNKVISKYRVVWDKLPLPVILHVVVNNIPEVRRCMERIEGEEAIDAVELGLSDEISTAEVEWHVRAAVEQSEKPALVRLPFGAPIELALAAVDGGADALVVAAPPRGTARDRGGKLVAGRLYGPMIKPMILRLVGQIARRVDVPVIGAGGIHSPQDARDYLEAGACAVQVDSATWVEPKLLEAIARDLGGLVLTQPAGALADEWHPAMGETERRRRTGDQSTEEAP